MWKGNANISPNIRQYGATNTFNPRNGSSNQMNTFHNKMPAPQVGFNYKNQYNDSSPIIFKGTKI